MLPLFHGVVVAACIALADPGANRVPVETPIIEAPVIVLAARLKKSRRFCWPALPSILVLILVLALEFTFAFAFQASTIAVLPITTARRIEPATQVLVWNIIVVEIVFENYNTELEI